MNRTIKTALILFVTAVLLFCCFGIMNSYAEVILREEWDGSVAVEGTDYIINEGVYEIYTPLGLAYVAEKTNEGTDWSAEKSFRLMNDIDIGAKDWVPIGSTKELGVQFKGYFDFNGYKILNLTRTLDYSVSVESTSWFGVFGVSTGQIINPYVTVGDVVINTNSTLYFGGVAGQSNGIIGSISGDADITVIIKGNYSVTTTDGQVRIGAVAGQLMGTSTVLGAASSGDVSIKAVIEENAVLSGKGTMHIFAGGIAGFDAHGTMGSCGDGKVSITSEIYGKLKGETSSMPINIGGIVGNNSNAVIGNSYDGISGDVKITAIIGENGQIYAKATNPASLVRMGGIFGQADSNTIGISYPSNTANVKVLFSCLAEGDGNGFYVDGGNVSSSAIGGIGGVAQKETTRIGTAGGGKAGFASMVNSSQFTVVNNTIAWIGAVMGNNAQGAKFGGNSLNSGRAFARAFSDSALKITGFNNLNSVQTENQVKVIYDNGNANGKLVIEEISFDEEMNAAASSIGFSARAVNGYYISGFNENGNAVDKEFKKGDIYAYADFVHTADTVWDIEPVFTAVSIPQNITKEYSGQALSPFDNEGNITYSHSEEYINAGLYTVTDVTVKNNGGVVGCAENLSGIEFTIAKRTSTTAPEGSMISIDYINEKVTFDGNLIEVSSSNDYSQIFVSGDSVVMGDLYFRYKETENTVQSDSNIITLSRPSTVVAEVSAVTSNSIVMTQKAGAEYRLESGGFQSGANFSGLTKNTDYTVYVRLAATQNSFASDESSVTVTTLNSFTVSFVTNGGSTISDMETDEGGQIALSPYTVRDGYRFLGWFDNQNLDGVAITFPYTVTADVIFCAKWEQIDYITVSFETNGGSAVNEISAEKNSAIQSAAIPEKPFNVFDGWYDNAEFNGQPVTFPASFSEDTVLYAKWNIIKYVVTVNIGEGAEAEFKGGTNRIEHGSAAEFKIISEENYNISNITVKLGSQTLTADSEGYYKIENVTQPVLVAVTGITENQATPTPAPEQKSGCGGTANGNLILAALITAVGVCLIIRRRKNNEIQK